MNPKAEDRERRRRHREVYRRWRTGELSCQKGEKPSNEKCDQRKEGTSC